MRQSVKKWLRLAGMGCFLMCGLPLQAQEFRRISTIEEVEEGGRYVLAAPNPADGNTIFALWKQSQTGTGLKNRTAGLFPLTDEGTLRLSGAEHEPAVFELHKLGSQKAGEVYGLKDILTEAWLAYQPMKSLQSNTSLYTLKDDELSTGTYRTFIFDFTQKRSFLLTDRGVYHTQQYGIGFSGESLSVFKLYHPNYGEQLIMFKEVVPPYKTEPQPGDWTFKGDWQAKDLCGIDFTQAARIDFTSIALPAGWTPSAFPGAYVWTYVRQGQGERLPSGWPNVIEVGNENGEKRGVAVTPVKAYDGMGLPAKYAFRTSGAKGGICWKRAIPGDGGWQTTALCFVPEQITWDGPTGESVEADLRQFAGWSQEGVVFERIGGLSEWKAGVPYLWRTEAGREGEVCFSAGETEVVATPEDREDWPLEAGFYTVNGTRSVTAGSPAVYLLGHEGTHFVRALPGSRIHPGRGFLCMPGNKQPSWRILTPTTGVRAQENCRQEAGSKKVYTPDGRYMGILQDGNRQWPARCIPGVYIVGNRKVRKPAY